MSRCTQVHRLGKQLKPKSPWHRTKQNCRKFASATITNLCSGPSQKKTNHRYCVGSGRKSPHARLRARVSVCAFSKLVRHATHTHACSCARAYTHTEGSRHDITSLIPGASGRPQMARALNQNNSFARAIRPVHIQKKYFWDTHRRMRVRVLVCARAHTMPPRQKMRASAPPPHHRQMQKSVFTCCGARACNQHYNSCAHAGKPRAYGSWLQAGGRGLNMQMRSRAHVSPCMLRRCMLAAARATAAAERQDWKTERDRLVHKTVRTRILCL